MARRKKAAVEREPTREEKIADLLKANETITGNIAELDSQIAGLKDEKVRLISQQGANQNLIFGLKSG